MQLSVVEEKETADRQNTNDLWIDLSRCTYLIQLKRKNNETNEIECIIHYWMARVSPQFNLFPFWISFVIGCTMYVHWKLCPSRSYGFSTLLFRCARYEKLGIDCIFHAMDEKGQTQQRKLSSLDIDWLLSLSLTEYVAGRICQIIISSYPLPCACVCVWRTLNVSFSCLPLQEVFRSIFTSLTISIRGKIALSSSEPSVIVQSKTTACREGDENNQNRYSVFICVERKKNNKQNEERICDIEMEREVRETLILSYFWYFRSSYILYYYLYRFTLFILLFCFYLPIITIRHTVRKCVQMTDVCVCIEK